jgi:hypothetical protein
MGSGSAGLSSVATTGSCTAGDFAIALFYSGATPSPGTGWTQIAAPTNNLMEWQKVAATGTVMATASGTTGNTGAAVAYYKP